MKTINSLKIGIQSIFERIGCTTEEIPELLGTTGVSESNMMHYLGLIESRTNEILQMYAACQSKGGFDPDNEKGTAAAAAAKNSKDKDKAGGMGADGSNNDPMANLQPPDKILDLDEIGTAGGHVGTPGGAHGANGAAEIEESKGGEDDDTRQLTIKDF